MRTCALLSLLLLSSPPAALAAWKGGTGGGHELLRGQATLDGRVGGGLVDSERR